MFYWVNDSFMYHAGLSGRWSNKAPVFNNAVVAVSRCYFTRCFSGRTNEIHRRFKAFFSVRDVNLCKYPRAPDLSAQTDGTSWNVTVHFCKWHEVPLGCFTSKVKVNKRSPLPQAWWIILWSVMMTNASTSTFCFFSPMTGGIIGFNVKYRRETEHAAVPQSSLPTAGENHCIDKRWFEIIYNETII